MVSDAEHERLVRQIVEALPGLTGVLNELVVEPPSRSRPVGV